MLHATINIGNCTSTENQLSKLFFGGSALPRDKHGPHVWQTVVQTNIHQIHTKPNIHQSNSTEYNELGHLWKAQIWKLRQSWFSLPSCCEPFREIKYTLRMLMKYTLIPSLGSSKTHSWTEVDHLKGFLRSPPPLLQGRVSPLLRQQPTSLDLFSISVKIGRQNAQSHVRKDWKFEELWYLHQPL